MYMRRRVPASSVIARPEPPAVERGRLPLSSLCDFFVPKPFFTRWCDSCMLSLEAS